MRQPRYVQLVEVDQNFVELCVCFETIQVIEGTDTCMRVLFDFCQNFLRFVALLFQDQHNFGVDDNFVG